jgi:hypothetical protein
MGILIFNQFNSKLTTLPTTIPQSVVYWLSEHPSIVNFRWNNNQLYGNTWSFLFYSIATYILAATTLHLIFRRRRRTVPLGPIPALYCLTVSLLSAVIFVGTVMSAAAEIRDTRWLWRRTRTETPLHWLMCFPMGTRPSGRVFFWSYVFYLSRLVHLSRTFLNVSKLSFFKLFNHSILLVMSYLWLEYSQSFQIVAILLATMSYAIVYGYRFWTAIGLPSACFPIVVICQILMLGCNLICHFGVLLIYLLKGGCNGIGVWGINSVLNAVILLLFLKFYLRNKKNPT